jgi:hypothetical protein
MLLLLIVKLNPKEFDAFNDCCVPQNNRLTSNDDDDEAS